MRPDVRDCYRRFGVLWDDLTMQHALDRIAHTTERELALAGGAAIVLWDAAKDRFVAGSSTVTGQDRRGAFRGVRSNGASRWLIEEEPELIVTGIGECSVPSNAMLPQAGIGSFCGVRIGSPDAPRGVLYAMEPQSEVLWLVDEVHELAEYAHVLLDAMQPKDTTGVVHVMLADVELDGELRRGGIRVTQTRSAERLLRTARCSPPDILVVGSRVGSHDGCELALTLRRDLPFHEMHVWIVADDRDAPEPELLGLLAPDGVVSPPVKATAIASIVDRVLVDRAR